MVVEAELYTKSIIHHIRYFVGLAYIYRACDFCFDSLIFFVSILTKDTLLINLI